MRKYGLIAICAAGLAACAPMIPAGDGPQTAEQVAAAEVEAQMPGVDVNAIANCVRDNATPEELEALAAGTGAAQQSLTARIIQRPATMACIQRNNAAPTGGS